MWWSLDRAGPIRDNIGPGDRLLGERRLSGGLARREAVLERGSVALQLVLRNDALAGGHE